MQKYSLFCVFKKANELILPMYAYDVSAVRHIYTLCMYIGFVASGHNIKSDVLCTDCLHKLMTSTGTISYVTYSTFNNEIGKSIQLLSLPLSLLWVPDGTARCYGTIRHSQFHHRKLISLSISFGCEHIPNEAASFIQKSWKLYIHRFQYHFEMSAFCVLNSSSRTQK